MGKALLLCDNSKRRLKESPRYGKSRKRLPKSSPTDQSKKSLSTLKSLSETDPSSQPMPERHVLRSSTSSSTPHLTPGNRDILDRFTQGNLSPPYHITKLLPSLASKRNASAIMNSRIPLRLGGPYSHQDLARMNGRSQIQSSPRLSAAFSAPLQRFFGRKRAPTPPPARISISPPILQESLNPAIDHGYGTTGLPYSSFDAGPPPVQVETISKGAPTSDSPVHRSQLTKESSSSSSSGPSPPSSRNSRWMNPLRTSSIIAGSSSSSSAKPDNKTWGYFKRSKSVPKNRTRVPRPSPSLSPSPSPPHRPVASSDTLYPFTNLFASPALVASELPETGHRVTDRIFEASALETVHEPEEQPQASFGSTVSVYHGEIEGRETPPVLTSTLDSRLDGALEEVQAQVEEHRRRAFYCLNGETLKRQQRSEHDLPAQIFGSSKARDSRMQSRVGPEAKAGESSTQYRRQLSDIRESANEEKYENASERRRRRVVEMPPPKEEVCDQLAFQEWLEETGRKVLKQTRHYDKHGVEVTAEGQVVDHGSPPLPLPHKSSNRRLLQEKQRYHAERPVKEMTQQYESWWERRNDSDSEPVTPTRPREADAGETVNRRSQASSTMARVAIEPAQISPILRSPNLPHFHTIAEAEAYRLSQSSTSSVPPVPPLPPHIAQARHIFHTPRSSSLPHFRTIEVAEKYRRSNSPMASQVPALRQEDVTVPTLPDSPIFDLSGLAPPTQGEQAVSNRNKKPKKEKYRFSRWLQEEDPGLPGKQPEIPLEAASGTNEPTPSGPSSSKTSATTLSSREKEKLRPEPLDLSVRRAAPAPPPPTTPKKPNPFLDENGRLLSKSQREKRFTLIRKAAAEAFETPALACQAHSPVSDRTWPSSASPSTPGPEQNETPPSSPPYIEQTPHKPSAAQDYEDIAASSPYYDGDDDDNDDDDNDDEATKSEIVNLYLSPEPSPNPCDGMPHPINGEPAPNRTFNCEDQRERELEEMQELNPGLDFDEVERLHWRQMEAKRRVERIRRALRGQSFYAE